MCVSVRERECVCQCQRESVCVSVRERVCVLEREREREKVRQGKSKKKFAIYCRSTLHWRFNEPTLCSFRVVHYQPEKECEKKLAGREKKSPHRSK